MPSTHKGIDDSEGKGANQTQNYQCRDGCYCPFNHKNDHGPERDLDVSYYDFAVSSAI
jgi:hypothetical protein